ncbi:hypothetical protein EC973_002653 [Apophysomyces ossiformis]|uniref:Coth-domain-containing protein n=1 Tax=Apophysomyces ossiformis TaxID=679940 RepID=A0A8H7BGH1_9FUNG|nr:hypothetical protein EC973_002653 [Apophysomyces ossiformis]
MREQRHNSSPIFILAYLFASLVAAHKATYNVIGIPVKNDQATVAMGVLVDGHIHRLYPSNRSLVLHQGEAPNRKHYRYVQYNLDTNEIIDSEAEDRPPVKNTSSLNEFYGRSWTRKATKKFQSLAHSVHFNRTHTDLHPSDEIPTIHIMSAEEDVNQLHDYYLKDIDIPANMTYLRADSISSFTNVRFKIGGRSSRLFTKLSYNINLPKDQKLKGYRKLKLRAAASDPSYMREKLAYDMLYAAGMPASQASYVRLFINDRAIGLFLLVEKYDDTWLKNEFHGGVGRKHGVLYEGKGIGKDSQTSSDLSYHGSNTASYIESAYELKELDTEEKSSDFHDLMELTKFIDAQIKAVKEASNETKDAWEGHLDVRVFLTNMAFEFLQGSWDGYLQNAENYYLYKHPVNKRFIWIPWDLEYVMGSGPVSISRLLEGDYRQFDGISHRPLIKGLLDNTKYRKIFDDTLRELIALYDQSFPVIDSLAEFLQQDVAWDQSQPHMRDGFSFLPLGPNFVENVLLNNLSQVTAPLPLSMDYMVAADYLIRINQHISFDTAIEGNTEHSSLMGVKEWIRQKSESVKKYLLI